MSLTVGELVGYLTLDDSQWQRGLNRANASAKRTTGDIARGAGGAGRAVDDMGRRSAAASGKLSTFGRNLGDIGAGAGVLPGYVNPATGAIAGLGIAAFAAGKQAISWESAWTGVTKTVDGSPEQMAALEGELRNLAKTLPSTHTEIAAVAEAAGQLGIETDSVDEFTKTMIDLGETTNLSAEEAATALARFMNIMGTSQTDVDRLGSSVVELGNNFATTEAEIVNMSTRIASAGRQLGLTEGDVLGLATALSSVGIEAEAGGTAISRVMIEMAQSVEMGNDKLAIFARVAGTSVDEFSAKFRDNAGGAISDFIVGLGRVQEQGGPVLAILDELGFTDVRVGNALRSAASAGDLFAEAMKTGNRAFDENTALAEEANKRYETMESRLEIAGNRAKDAAMTIGGPLAEAFVAIVDPISKAISKLDEWSESLAPSYEAGGTTFDAQKDGIFELIDYINALDVEQGDAAQTAERLAEGYHALAIAQVQAKADSEGLLVTSGSLNAALSETGDTADVVTDDFADFTGGVKDAGEEAKAAAKQLDALEDAVLSLGDSYQSSEAAQDAVTRAVRDARQPMRDLQEANAELTKARKDLADADGKAAKEAARERLERAEQAVAAAEAAFALKGNSEAALDNRERLRALADTVKDSAAEFFELDKSGFTSRQEMERGRKKFIEVAEQLGMTKKEAREYANQLGLVPGKVPTKVFISNYDQAMTQAQAIANKINGIKDRNVAVNIVTTEIRRDAAAASRGTNPQGIQGKRASGGPTARGQAYMVGEQGPELFVPGTAGSVIPSHRSVDNSRRFDVHGNVILQTGQRNAWDVLDQLAVS